MQTSLRPVVATAAAAADYQYYQASGLHQQQVMPEPVDESGLSINQYRQYDNYHHQQLIHHQHHHHHHQQQQQQQVTNFHQQTIEPICYTSLGDSVDEHQIVAYDNGELQHYQLLEAAPRVVEVEQLGGDQVYQHQQQLLPEQQELRQQQQQQETSYQTIYYEPSVGEQPLIEQHLHQAPAFASESPTGCYHQFQYHQPHIEACGLVLDASHMAQANAEPQVQATEPATQSNYPDNNFLQPASFDKPLDGNLETSEQLQYRALELARVKNSSSDYLQQQHQESVETTSALLIHSQPPPTTGMTHHHHSHDHSNHHHHHHPERDESLSSSASSTSSTSSAASTSEESSASSLTRDERKAREANIPLSYYEIVNLSIEQFNEQLAKYSLSEAQLTLIKDIRRRGKNKVAAQSCRKRKMEQIFELQHEVHNLANKRRNLGYECSQLVKEHADLVQEYDKVYAIIQEQMRPHPTLTTTSSPTSAIS